MRRRHCQHRPQPLAAGLDQIACKFRDHVDMRLGTLEDQRIDLCISGCVEE